MLLNMTNLESYNCAKRKGLKHSNFLVWTGIRQAIPLDLKRIEVNENKLRSLEFQCGEKVFNPLTSKSKHFFMNCLFQKKLESQEVLESGKKSFAWTTQLFPFRLKPLYFSSQPHICVRKIVFNFF